VSGFIAVGVGHWAHMDDGWDLRPLLAAVFILMILRGLTVVRFSPAVIVIALVGGTLYASAVDALGFPAATSLGFIVTVLVTLPLRRPPSKGRSSTV
jgi:hypothetical protein